MKVILLLISILSLGGGFALAIFGQDMSTPPTAGSSAYSRSALGHQVAFDLLEKLGIHVVLSRHESGLKARSSLLIIAEPVVDSGNSDQLREMAQAAKRTLLVLPKRDGVPDPMARAWISESEMVPISDVSSTLAAFVDDAKIARLSGAESPELETSDFATPTVSGLQVIESEELEPIIQTSTGQILLGQTGSGVWVLSDPDILANHGIGHGDNAVLFTQIISAARESGDTVVVDEVLHGYRTKPSIWRSLFEFPLVLVSAQVGLLTLMLLWALTRRFGKPVKAVGGIDPGKEFLIENTASLLHFGGHTSDMLRRYFDDTVRHVRSRLHTPETMNPSDAQAWLDRVGASRGVEDSLASVQTQVREVLSSTKLAPRRAGAVAQRIHKWKEEMLHGPSKRTTA